VHVAHGQSCLGLRFQYDGVIIVAVVVVVASTSSSSSTAIVKYNDYAISISFILHLFSSSHRLSTCMECSSCP
jgi:hypothetical protein